MFLENDSHFGRHLGFLENLQEDCRGLLVCYYSYIPGPVLKNSACLENVHLLTNALGQLRKSPNPFCEYRIL